METFHCFLHKMNHPGTQVVEGHTAVTDLCGVCSPKELVVFPGLKLTTKKEQGKAFFAESCHVLDMNTLVKLLKISVLLPHLEASLTLLSSHFSSRSC